MSTTTHRAELFVKVGENGHPIRLTDEAVEAVQAEAAGNLTSHMDELAEFWAAHSSTAADLDAEKLLELRATAQAVVETSDVLLDIRPDEEWDEYGVAP